MPKINETDNAIEFLMQDLEMELTDEHVGAFQVIMEDIKQLRQRDILLSCMEMAGVDNWDGDTSEVMEEYYPEEYKRRYGDG